MADLVHQDMIDPRSQVLVDYLKVVSVVSNLFTAKDIQIPENSNVVLLPDIIVDDRIGDVNLARIGADHYSGNSYTPEWTNGIPPVFWRAYSTSRNRAFGYTVMNEQKRLSPIKNLEDQYLARKMQTTVVRDHDKYVMLAAVMGHMTGKLVARMPSDTPAPVTKDAHLISCTGNAADYRWINEPGEHYDNERPPSFAAIKGMQMDVVNPANTFDALTLMFSTNWFDSNYGTDGRIMLITPAFELSLLNIMIEKGQGTEKAFEMFMNGDVSGVTTPGYIGSFRGWTFVRMHPEFFPKVYTDDQFVVNPVADSTTSGVKLRQVCALAVYRDAVQVVDFFSKRLEEDGGIRFDGKDYVHHMRYDAWVIDQKSEGVVPIFLPDSAEGFTPVTNNFADVMAKVNAGRAQTGTPTTTYPITGADTLKSRPGWFHPPYNTGVFDASKTKEAGDTAVDKVKEG